MGKYLVWILAAGLVPSLSFSQSTTWTGSSNSTWTTVGNWTNGTSSSSIDAVFGNFAGSAPSTGNGARFARNVDFTRTIGAYTFNFSDLGSFTASTMTTGTGSSELTMRGGGDLQAANFTINSSVILGATNQASSSVNSQLDNVTILGTTTLNAGATLTAANLTGTTSLGSLQMNGGTFNIVSGNGIANGTTDGGTQTINVNRLNGTSGVIKGAKVTTGTAITTGVLAVSGTVDGNYGGSISNGLSNNVLALTKSGTNTQTLSGANTYTGATTVSGGTLNVSAENALGGTSQITVGSAGLLQISATNSVNNSAAVTLSGGTILRGSGVSETMGALNLTANSTIDFGTGAIGTLTFGAYTPTFLLTVANFAQGDSLVFASDLRPVFSGSYSNYFNFGGQAFSTAWNGSNFTITSVPEPFTTVAAVVMLGLFGWRCWRNRSARLAA